MTNQNFPRRVLDDAIDRAVREMVQGDARPGLRRRVLDRIQAPRTQVVWWPKILVPAGALAAIALAVVLLRPDSAPTPTQNVAVTGVPTIAPGPAPQPERAPQTGSGPERPAASGTPSARPPRTAKRDEPVQFDFGQRSGRVTATSVPGAARGVASAVNVRIDVTITERRDDVTAPPRTVTLTVANGVQAQARNAGGADQRLTIDARPELLPEGRIRVNLQVNYRGEKTAAHPAPALLSQEFASIVEDGKPLVVTEWREAGSTRSVKVELKATILR